MLHSPLLPHPFPPQRWWGPYNLVYNVLCSPALPFTRLCSLSPPHPMPSICLVYLTATQGIGHSLRPVSPTLGWPQASGQPGPASGQPWASDWPWALGWPWPALGQPWASGCLGPASAHLGLASGHPGKGVKRSEPPGEIFST